MTFYKKSLGAIGEQIAADYLLKKDFIILDRNFYTRVGEIDIIARRADKLHFVEVKTRTNLNKGKPYEAVNGYKISHLLKAANIYLLQKKIKLCNLSLDIISIWMDRDKKVKEILYFENITL